MTDIDSQRPLWASIPDVVGLQQLVAASGGINGPVVTLTTQTDVLGNALSNVGDPTLLHGSTFTFQRLSTGLIVTSAKIYFGIFVDGSVGRATGDRTVTFDMLMDDATVWGTALLSATPNLVPVLAQGALECSGYGNGYLYQYDMPQFKFKLEAPNVLDVNAICPVHQEWVSNYDADSATTRLHMRIHLYFPATGWPTLMQTSNQYTMFSAPGGFYNAQQAFQPYPTLT